MLQHARRSQSYRRRATSIVVCSAVLFSCSDAESPTDAADTVKLDEMKSVSGYLLPKAEKTISNGQEVVTIGFEHDEVADDGAFTIDPFGQVEGATFGSIDYDSLWNVCPDANVASPTCGNTANVPSPTHAAIINGFGYSAVIRFDPPVSSVRLLYAAYITNDHTLYAYNSAGQLLASAPAPGNSGQGYMDTWDTVSVDVGSDLIRKAVYIGVGSPNLDDLTFTRKATCSDIFPGSTGDPVLESPEVQKALFDALVESQAFGPDPAIRLEEGGYIYERPDGSYYGVRTGNPQKQTACTVAILGPTTGEDPADEVRAAYHSHPFSHDDLLPASCEYGAGAQYNARGVGGALSSGEDGDWASVESDQIPHYVIDLDNVYRGDPGTPESQRRDAPSWPWDQSNCY